MFNLTTTNKAIKRFQLNKLSDSINEIINKQLFNKRFTLISDISVVIYDSQALEIHQDNEVNTYTVIEVLDYIDIQKEDK